MGQVIFMPASAVFLMTLATVVACDCGHAITPSWIILALIFAAILAVATPPMPGGGLTAMTIFFIQLDFPMELLSTYAILNIIFDYLTTATNVFCLQSELVLLADNLDLIEEDVLHNME